MRVFVSYNFYASASGGATNVGSRTIDLKGDQLTTESIRDMQHQIEESLKTEESFAEPSVVINFFQELYA